MNRQQRRAQAALSKELAKERPDVLTPIPRAEWPTTFNGRVLQAWHSKKYHAQLWQEHAGMLRLSICRVTKNTNDRWVDGLTWDELQAIKNEVGYGDWYAVEVYPPDKDVVNVANMRHLWLMAIPLPIGWVRESGAT